ncbi:MAG: PAS domain-containing protein [Ignavibacteriota bacterium]
MTGVLLSDSSGHPQGILSVRFRIPPTDLGEIEAALLRFAPRAAVEIERTRPAEIRYQELIEQGSDAVWCLEPLPPIPLNLPEDEIVARCWESRIAVANDAAARLLEGEHPSNVVEHRVGEFRALLPNLETQIRRQIRDGFRPRTEEFCDVRDGVESWWERSVLPIVAGGKFLRAWATTRDISERHRYDEDIQALNTTLQNVVADRTAQLAAANRELESFSHSVSHDLRAAIQGILACSRIVVQDYGNKLDDTAKLWLTHMAEDAAQLDKLTMALLDLTLVSRAHFSRGPVDLSGLAESTCQRLAESGPGASSPISHCARAGGLRRRCPAVHRNG